MPYYPNFNASPMSPPFRQPISAHPPAAPCGPGRVLAEGAYVSRGGVFEGPAMAQGDSHCGYWSDHIGDVSLWDQSYPPRYPTPSPMGLRRVLPYPAETRSHFQPRQIMLGFPQWTYGMTHEGPVAGLGGPIFTSGGVAGRQLMDPMRTVHNRSRQVWTGPLNSQQDWPDMMTPRGGVLDGNTLAYKGQGPYSAFYDSGGSPEVMLPPDQIDVLPNPLDQGPVPSVGWGVPGTPPGMQLAAYGEYYSAPGAGGVRQLSPMQGYGEYFTPAAVRQNYGVQEATRPAPIMRGDQRATQPQAVCPKAVSSSIFGGRVPGGPTIARSIFSMPVYENGGDVPERVTVTPRDLAVPATNAAAAVISGCFGGVGPDGLGATPIEYGRPSGTRRARVRALMRERRRF